MKIRVKEMTMGFSKLLKVLLLSIALSFYAGISYADEVSTQLSKDEVAMGDTLTLLFTLDGKYSQSPDFSPLQKDFDILDTNYGNTVNMINGVTSSQSFWRLTLAPKKTGSITLPEILFGNDKSAVLQLKVTEATVRKADDKKNSSVFTTATISTTKPYVQGLVIYTFKLFFQQQLENPRIEMPQIKDVTILQLGEGNQYRATVNGKLYMVVEKNFAIFPQKSGDIAIAPTFLRTLTDVGNSDMRNDPFYMPDLQSLSLATQSFNLDVQKIPDTFHGSTWLPAKNLTLGDNWSTNPANLELGNPVTRTITVTAEGLRSDQLPDLTIDKIAGMNMYIDPPKRSDALKDNMVIGTLEQKVTYIPNSQQPLVLPAVKLNWWNTQTNSAALAQLDAIAIQVGGKVNNTLATPSRKTPVFATNTKLKPSAQSLAATQPFYLSIWFWLAVFFLVSWLASLWLILRKRSEKNNIVPAKPVQPVPSFHFSAKGFAQACEQGNALLAQQFLLTWAKQQWKMTTLNLEDLRSLIINEEFDLAIQHLEQTIYGKTVASWQGNDLLAAFQAFKKQGKHTSHRVLKTVPEPLPPLNP
jgi:hypothetical protein